MFVYPGDRNYGALKALGKGRQYVSYCGIVYRKSYSDGDLIFIAEDVEPIPQMNETSDLRDLYGNWLPEIRDHFGYND